MATQQVYSTAADDQYSFVNEDQIDSNLKCTVCGRPFVKPMVGKRCGHTFCQACINNWHQRILSCPVCRTSTSFEPLTTRVVLSQLDRLLVRCSYCYEDDILRGDFANHIQYHCRQIKVRCKAADLKCAWIGRREDLAQHTSVCPLLHIRPVIDELRAAQSAQTHQIQMFMNEMRDRIHNLQQQFVYKAHDQNRNNKDRYEAIKNDMKYCWVTHQHQNWSEERTCMLCTDRYRYLRKCLVCSRDITPENIHFYDSFPRITDDFICKACVAQYS